MRAPGQGGCTAARRRWTPRARSQRRSGRRQPHLSQCRVALARRSSSRRARTQRPCHPRAERPELGGPRPDGGVEAAATTGDRRLAAHALVQRGFLRLFTDEEVTPRELFDVSDRAIAVFEGLDDELGLARAWRLAGQAHYLDRRPGLCGEASEHALEHARRASDRFEEREIVEWLVIVLLLGPAPAAEAIARCERLLDETLDNPELHAQIYTALASLAAMQGRLDEGRELMERSNRIMVDLGEWIWIVTFWWGYRTHLARRARGG